MKRIEFEKKQRNLHGEILSAIIDLMNSNKCERIVFNERDQRMPHIVRWLQGTDIYESVSVGMLRCDGKGLSYKATVSPDKEDLEKQWWSLRHNVAFTHIIGLYRYVFRYFENDGIAA